MTVQLTQALPRYWRDAMPTTHTINGRQIKTWHEFPPIPDRRFDYGATDGDYDLGAKIGWGPTEQDAIKDLLDQLEDA